jgi:uncharacterized membrane protein YkoI
MRLALTMILLAALPLLPAAADAFALDRAPAAPHEQAPVPQLGTTQSDGMTLSQAIESVRKQTGGRVVSAETKVQGGREVHHIKVLMENGKVKTFKVNGPKR